MCVAATLQSIGNSQKAIPDMLDDEDISEMHASGTRIRERVGELRAEHLTQYRNAMHPA